MFRPLLFLAALVVSTMAGSIPQLSLAGQSEGGVHTFESWSYSDCSLPGNPVVLKSIVLDPKEPKPGKNLTVTVVADVLETIEEGAYADVTVKMGFIRLIKKEFDLCEEARNANASVSCPIEKGPYEVVQTVELPSEIPQAKFAVEVDAYTVDDDDLLCLRLQINFMKKLGFAGW